MQNASKSWVHARGAYSNTAQFHHGSWLLQWNSRGPREITDMKAVFGARNGTHFSIDIKEEIILVSVDIAQTHFQ